MAFANPYYQNQYQMPQYQARDWPMLKGRPVTSIDEVRASQVDFDGSVSYFPDTAHNTIYTKQINLDGTASIHARGPAHRASERTAPAIQQHYITCSPYTSTNVNCGCGCGCGMVA